MRTIKKISLPFILLLLSCITGCDNEVDWSNGCYKLKFSYNRAFEIPEKSAMQSVDGQYRLRFDSVFTDSRCPQGAYCVWQGIAGARFTLSRNNSELESFDLYTWNNPGANWSDSALCKNLKIRLLELSPYPSVDLQNSYNNYKARIIVTKQK